MSTSTRIWKAKLVKSEAYNAFVNVMYLYLHCHTNEPGPWFQGSKPRIHNYILVLLAQAYLGKFARGCEEALLLLQQLLLEEAD